MRKIIFFIAFTGLWSCNSDEQSSDSISSEIPYQSRQAVSIGEEHNLMLSEMFDYLEEINNLDESNVGFNVNEFFETNLNEEESATAMQYYNYHQQTNYDIYEDFTPQLKIEVENLNGIIDNADFSNMEEFKTAVRQYRLTTTLSQQEQQVWDAYTDVFVHSFEYWEENLDSWEILIKGNASDPIVKNNGWIKRLWNKIKTYVAADAAGAGSAASTGIIVTGTVGIGAVVGAGVGASVGVAIKNLFL